MLLLELQLLLRGVLAAELTLTISSSSSTCRPNDQVHELSSPLDAKIWLPLLLELQLLLRGVLAAELTLTVSSSSSTCRPNDQVHELSNPLDALNFAAP